MRPSSAVTRATGAVDDATRRVVDRFEKFPTGAVDSVLTVVVTLATVGPAVLAGRPWWVVGLSVLASVPVLWRRRAPLAVFLVVGPAMTVLACLHAMPELAYGTVVCAYTIAAYSPPARRRAAFVSGAIGIVVSLVIPAESADSYAYAAMSFLTAWALGTGVRAKRAQIDMLEERARRLDEERLAALDRERLRIARDMHDIVTHSVGTMIVQAETGPLFTGPDRERADAVFASIAETGRVAVQQLRRSLDTLRGETADPRHQPGIEAIADLVELSRHGGLSASLAEDGPRRAVSDDVAVTAYRVVQEALTNTMKHARATAVRVSLRWTDQLLTVRVCDDGAGPVQAASGGYGLLGMRERVVGAGGTLRHGPSPTGFDVAAELPLGQRS
ncbi:signal transduction histidine kinase [Nocardia tenerifensis]|uniref:histidine kinase n=1 Tax=Nocardia tenerifensis TaxID=228006 RepID=A0A318K5D5_9NOCA|nr:sensor histidine kinase [Nocardia tenerifensis]PXX64320.1 signal transduction histidine kinase [Nocardia tenerifensis]